jgi:hypothetical protein
MTIKEFYDFPMNKADDIEFLKARYGASETIRLRKELSKAIERINIGAHGDLELLYKVILDPDEMSFMGFISIESTLASSVDEATRDILLLEQILRPLGEEEWEQAPEEHIQGIMKLPVEDAYYYIRAFLKNREHFHYTKYKDVFYRTKEEWELSESDDDTISEREAPQSGKNYWYTIISELGGSDILKYDAILKQPMALVAPEWSFRRQQALEEQNRIAKQEVINRTRTRR